MVQQAGLATTFGKNPMTASAIIEVVDVKKTFMVGSQTVQVLRGVSAQIQMGDFVIIVGPSGCGKSTLLHVILGLEEPSEGSVVFLGEKIYNNTSEDYRSDFRKKHIGMVYQQPNWIKSMTVAENVAFPMLLLGMDKDSARTRALELLGKLKMTEWADYMPTELSGGQQQRVSLARALSNNPEIIIADEPTGNLDYQTGQEVMLMLQDLNKNEQKTVVMVTHDLEYLKYANSAIKILDGQIDAVFDSSQIHELLSTTQSQQKRGSQSIGLALQVHQSSGIPTQSAEAVAQPEPVSTKPVKETSKVRSTRNSTQEEVGKRLVNKGNKADPIITVEDLDD